MSSFLWGALTVASAIAGLFFLHFWRRSDDRLFAFFAAAFWVLALNWLTLGIANAAFEHIHYVYVLRLLAFVLIIAGIIDKNRRG